MNLNHTSARRPAVLTTTSYLCNSLIDHFATMVNIAFNHLVILSLTIWSNFLLTMTMMLMSMMSMTMMLATLPQQPQPFPAPPCRLLLPCPLPSLSGTAKALYMICRQIYYIIYRQIYEKQSRETLDVRKENILIIG